ncbi:TolC family outer membrane protein [Spiribacter vilamensis]|uniref:Outer membrane protein n=1 Tax=Spiribacter vilamensis TaxID=531306 RepID=A0A4Q8D279_9GAMM|nr:TolC family outer membrane protein [Spiribacter vilamensis]RZU99400.1 outer membrane protein [Spiribacter vilamensis]TVO61623.1 TolC family outer membrane protein [Spiribacter vilamensis]
MLYPEKRPTAAALFVAALMVAVPNLVSAEGLSSIYEQARSSDPQFQQDVADLNAREELLPQAKAGLRPDVSLNSTFDAIDNRNLNDQYRELTYGISLNQPLYRYSQSQAVDQADAQVSQAQAEFAFAEQELILRVAERYFAVLDAREALDAAEANLEAIQRQLDQAEQRFEVGVIARTDVEEARAQADLARAERLQAKDDLASRREELRELTNRAPAELNPVKSGVSLTPPEPAESAAWRARAEEENRQLAAARFAAEAAMEGVDIQRGGRLPTADLVAGYNRSREYGKPGPETEANQLSAGVELNLPLYQGGEVSSGIREAQARYTEARGALEQTRRTVARNAANAYRGVLTALERVRALDQARVSTRAAVEATEAGFEVGTRTIVDVLNAQRELFNAERDYEQARHAYLLNTLRLQQAAGTLTEADLERVNALLGQT